MESYLIIGGGPGGYELAAEAAAKGHEVTLIERDKLGGTCLNRGCIPTKAMAHAADLLRESRRGGEYGINCDLITVDFPKLCARREEVIEGLRSGVEALMKGIKVIKGTAKFVGAKEVGVDTAEGTLTLTADRIVIATGSTPASLPIPGAEFAITSDQLLQLTEVPQTMTIIGGGVIGLEFASIFNELGSKVTVIEYCKEILPQFDKDVAKRVRQQLAAAGITFMVGAEVKSIEPYAVTYEQKGATSTCEGEVMVMAVGRRPALPEGLDKAGIELNRNAIKVDAATMETTSPGVYAIGDVNAICMLAHVATAQGRRVLGEKVNLDVIPSVVFTYPEVAMVGATEQHLKESATEYKAAKAFYRANGKAVSMGETTGLVKLLTDKTDGRILGCTIMGPHAADMIEEVAVAMANGLPASSLSSTIHPHPTLCEIIAAASR